MNGLPSEDADPYLPRHGDLRYSVDEYDLELDYKVETNRLVGQAKLTCVATEDLRRLSLDLAGLQVSKLTVNGASVKFSSQRNKIIIGLRSTVPAGDQFVVKVSYRGSPKPMAGPDGEAGWEELTDGVVVASQPHGAPSWFPCNDHPADKARYRIAVTAESAYHVLANGRLISRYRHASKTTWEYRQDQPMAPYLATVQIGRYAERVQKGAVVPIRLIFPPRSAARVTAAFAGQAPMINFFTGLFGDYPYDDYAVVVTADDLEIPVEAQGLSIFGSNFLKLDWDSQRLIAHELAHQWFGNSLTVKHWRDIWLNEGFACYSEWLWSEESGGPSAQAKAAEHWQRLKGLPQDLRLADPGAESMFDDRVYKRGALLLHALRRTIGDDSFFGLLRTWIAGHQHGLVTTKDFVKLATEAGGGKAADLLQAWLFELPLPNLPD